MIVLKWKGEGFVPGIPAKDLTAEEVEQYGGMERVLAAGGGGLYEPVEKKKKRRHANKALDPLRENKSDGSK